jgi:hypothetical protein
VAIKGAQSRLRSKYEFPKPATPCTLTKSARAKIKRGVDLISDALPFGRLCYGGPNAVTNATGYAMHDSRSVDAVIRVYNEAGNVIETLEHIGDFRVV